jgi:uncharacterized membrane protein YfcA
MKPDHPFFMQNAPLTLLSGDPHPFWQFDSDLIFSSEVVACSVVLFLSGILCSAAGIGGGGIYVAVLMVCGALSPYDAVPLSKSIVFFGALATLVVNTSRMFSSSETVKARNVIDFNVVRIVVPAALAGTYLGVLANSYADGRIIVAVLFCLLLFMTGLVVREAWAQYTCEEEIATIEEEEPLMPASSADAYRPTGEQLCPDSKIASSTFTSIEGTWALLALIIVIIGGILRFHMHACYLEQAKGSLIRRHCQNPIVMTLLWGKMEVWMKDVNTALFLQACVMSGPILMCGVMAIYYGCTTRSQAGWEWKDVVLYQLVALITGLLAGLVGVGGGLIFAPFFLVMGMDPATAVGTSSTCVLFTSSSTTMQYVFTDRIIMSLALVYGSVTCLASYTGSTLVHKLQDSYGNGPNNDTRSLGNYPEGSR